MHISAVKNAIGVIGTYVTGSGLIRHSIRYRVARRITGHVRPVISHNKKVCFRNIINVNVIRDYKYSFDNIEEVYKHYMNHEFNFLGTGWVNWNRSSEEKSIAWNKDIKSQYVFSEKKMHSMLISKLPKGVDIKIPWELGRMYHWPQLSILASQDESKKNRILREFKSQLIDFMDNNIIGEGVQFYCPMEIAIRSINLLISYDILCQIDELKILDDEFRNRIEIYLFKHAQIIQDNLEYDFVHNKSGNHFLSDICGLIWISRYFESNFSKRIKNTLKYEFEKCIRTQFLDDGSNFECSSAYHRLTTELVGMGLLAFLEAGCGEKIIKENNIRIRGMLRLLYSFVGKDKRIIQIGDNDSGSVIKLYPRYCFAKEDTLTADYVIDLMRYVLGDIDAVDKNFTSIFAYSLVKDYNKNSGSVRPCEDSKCICGKKEKCFEKENLKFYSKTEEVLSDFNIENATINIEENFGFIKVSDKVYDIYIRILPMYKRMCLAHVHDDVFHYEIVTNCKRIHEDIGSYVYTSNIEKRMFYSGNQSHQVPIHKKAIIDRTGVFEAYTDVKGQNYIDKDCIEIMVLTDKYMHVRKFTFENEKMIIEDWSDEAFDLSKGIREHSLGYGQKENGDKLYL